jgi:hypothetical protein
MKNAVLVTAIPDMDWVKTHGAMCLEVIRKYFERHNHELIVITERPKVDAKHNSWLWLLGHKLYPGYNYLLCWNLDILPQLFDVDIFDYLDMNRIAACVEFNGLSTFPYYRYNCGLVGMPQKYQAFFEGCFNKWGNNPKNWPSWEQYYVNMELGEQAIDVQEIPRKFNTFYESNEKDTVCVHYSFSVYKDRAPLATDAMEKHYKRLKKVGTI